MTDSIREEEMDLGIPETKRGTWNSLLLLLVLLVTLPFAITSVEARPRNASGTTLGCKWSFEFGGRSGGKETYRIYLEDVADNTRGCYMEMWTRPDTSASWRYQGFLKTTRFRERVGGTVDLGVTLTRYCMRAKVWNGSSISSSSTSAVLFDRCE